MNLSRFVKKFHSNRDLGSTAHNSTASNASGTSARSSDNDKTNNDSDLENGPNHRPRQASIESPNGGRPRPRHIPSIGQVQRSRSTVPVSDASSYGNFLDLCRSPTTVTAAAQQERTSPTITASGKCPFLHGTVYAGPYPGYVHGNPKRGMCPNGCRPEANVDVTGTESPKETLIREAMEFIELYYHERKDEMKGSKGFISKEERIDVVRISIDETGTYEHTFDELQHGARVAWRNTPKCANRKYWQQLKLLDCRDVTTNKGMFDCCIQHLAKAMSCGSSEAYITVFKSAPPGENIEGPRIWNDQLLQYAAYSDGGEVTGDPKNLRFTEMLKERFGWDGPPDGKQGPYDYLPLVIQSDPNGPPELFDVPLECAPPVFIHHPQYPELSSLSMRWYPIPAVCALDMTLGGILYTAVPFNGWYANTEVLRDLTDKGRYNMLVPVAKALGMDSDTKPGEAPFWIDDVMAILSKAVFHSFRTAKIAMIDHHNLINMFWDWYNDELKHRKYCPVNWKWVIPPMSSSTSQAYLGLNKAQEYTLKPAYIIGKNFLHLETNHFGRRDPTKALNDLVKAVYLAILFKRMVTRFRGRKSPVVIIYASVTGNAAKYASDLGSILRSSCNVSFFDACGINAARDTDILYLIKSATLSIFVTSSQGNGELPALSHKFFSFLFGENGHLLTEKQCAVLGFGSSAYPIFCGAAAYLSKKLAEQDTKEVIFRGECDAVKGEAPMFYEWTANLVEVMASMPSASPFMVKLSKNIKENTASVLVKRRNMIDYVTVEVFTAEEVKSAAALSFMTRRGGMGVMKSASMDSAGSIDGEETSRSQRIMNIISSSGSGHHNPSRENNLFAGQVTSREDLISIEMPEGESEKVTRKTSLVKIDLGSCGNPPYQPGDHIQVFPRNIVSFEKVQSFVSHLTGNLSLDDHMYVTFDNEDIPSSEIAVSLPLLESSLSHIIPLGYFFEKLVAVLAPISMQACLELSNIATCMKDKAVLSGLGKNENEYEKMNSLTGMKWIELFKIFPSLSKQVTMNFLLCTMKMNHPRSYSISSCKAIVGSELHLCVGRFIYSRGGSKVEAGVCSNFLTSVEPGDEILFKLESAPSFHYPLDPSCPIIFICTGTGFAPIRGLLQKRSYFQSRGEKMGPAFVIYGTRCSDEGLFHNEIKELLNKGVVTKCYLCYSREPGKMKEYTTDKLQSDRVRAILAPILAKENVHIFICGSANMAEKSKSALKEISSKSCIESITADGRLRCDVFGALSSRRSRTTRTASMVLGEMCMDNKGGRRQSTCN